MYGKEVINIIEVHYVTCLYIACHQVQLSCHWLLTSKVLMSASNRLWSPLTEVCANVNLYLHLPPNASITNSAPPQIIISKQAT